MAAGGDVFDGRSHPKPASPKSVKARRGRRAETTVTAVVSEDKHDCEWMAEERNNTKPVSDKHSRVKWSSV